MSVLCQVPDFFGLRFGVWNLFIYLWDNFYFRFIRWAEIDKVANGDQSIWWDMEIVFRTSLNPRRQDLCTALGGFGLGLKKSKPSEKECLIVLSNTWSLSLWSTQRLFQVCFTCDENTKRKNFAKCRFRESLIHWAFQENFRLKINIFFKKL